EDAFHAFHEGGENERPLPRFRLGVEMDMGADEPEGRRVHVDGPSPHESDPTPPRQAIGHGGAMDAHGTGQRLEAHPIAPEVRPAPDHDLPQDVEVEVVKSVPTPAQGWGGFGLDGPPRGSPANGAGWAGTSGGSAAF